MKRRDAYPLVSISYIRTVEPGVWRRNFPGVLAYKFWWSELLRGHTAGTNFDLSTAVGKMQMNFDLSTGQ